MLPVSALLYYCRMTIDESLEAVRQANIADLAGLSGSDETGDVALAMLGARDAGATDEQIAEASGQQVDNVRELINYEQTVRHGIAVGD